MIVAGVNSSPHLPDPSLSHLFDCGSFFSRELDGFLVSPVFVMFSLGGTEPVGITVGEAESPRWPIPEAVNQMIYRVLIFYIGVLLVVMTMVPWDTIGGRLSPFA